MNYLKWKSDVIYVLEERYIYPYYLLKDNKDNMVWESFYKIEGRFQITDTSIVFRNEVDAKRYCEINAQVKIKEQIQYLKSLLVD